MLEIVEKDKETKYQGIMAFDFDMKFMPNFLMNYIMKMASDVMLGTIMKESENVEKTRFYQTRLF